MYYENLIHDFAERTRANLATLRQLQATGQIYEVTQLVNSLLGLLVFPQQKFFNDIPETKISELEAGGWPIPKVSGHFRQARDLRELVRYLRNAVTHCNIRFTSDDRDEISGIRVWNEDTTKPHKPKTWEADLTITELEQLVVRFIELGLSAHPRPQNARVPSRARGETGR